MLRHALALALLMVGCLCLTACIPESEHPIAPITVATTNVELNGVWLHEDEHNGDRRMHFVHVASEADKGLTAAEPEAGLMKLWFVSHEKQDDGSWHIGNPIGMRFYASRVGKHNYLNGIVPLEGVPSPSPATKYLLMQYELVGSELSVGFINMAATAAAIEAGDLSGTVTREGDQIKAVQLRASSEQLSAYLAGPGGEALFPASGRITYRHIR